MWATDQSKSSREQTTYFTSSMGLSRPRLASRLAAASPEPGGLDVEDDGDPGVDPGGVDRAAGLEQDRPPGVGQEGHERQDFGLEQGLAPGHLDQAVAGGQGLLGDLPDRHRLARVEGVGGVAVGASEVAAVRRTKVQGSPAWVLSPWRLR